MLRTPAAATATYISMDENKDSYIKVEDTSKDSDPHTVGKTTPPRSDPTPIVKEPPDQSEEKNIKGPANAETTQPLAPPPRPAPAHQPTEEGLDYFSASHTNSHFSREPNPFEQSFGNPSTDHPNNKSLLPPVAALTSPAPLTGDGQTQNGYSWGGSLRSGPLSPAMLGGPVGAAPDNYFDPSLSRSFPSGVTPNESSLRTGLTPGGGGSMFPAPSPNSQALYQQLASGGATPSTLDFQRTALNAAAVRKGGQGPTNGASNLGLEDKRVPVTSMDPALQQQPQQPTFGQHDNDAANGLFLLAQAGNGAHAASQFAVPNPSTTNMNNQNNETSTNMSTSRNNGSIAGQSEMSPDLSDSGDQSKPTTRTRGKRTSGGKPAATNGKRKSEETPVKQTSAKKQKSNNIAMSIDMDGMDSDEEQQNIKEEQFHNDGRKMTDEEKRKNFLERNRVAALKCRQRKKQWLANLQAKVEIFSSENDSLSAQVATLREEIVGLKTLLLQHKDCPVSQQQGLGGYFQQQQQQQPDFNPHANPYGMGMSNNQAVMAGQRR